MLVRMDPAPRMFGSISTLRGGTRKLRTSIDAAPIPGRRIGFGPMTTLYRYGARRTAAMRYDTVTSGMVLRRRVLRSGVRHHSHSSADPPNRVIVSAISVEME